MARVPRIITDRIAIGDDTYTLVSLGDGRTRLIPAPDSIINRGTDVNKALMQPWENDIATIWNRVFGDITTNPFSITFETLEGVAVEGIWNPEWARIEC